MPSNRETLLCRYHYDPLDRLVDCTPSAQASAQRFYLKDRLATEIQGAVRFSIMQHDDQLLAQQQRQTSATEIRLFATDQQRSVLNALNAARPHPLAYSPYGHRPAENGLLSLLGFNGERPDTVTGWYLLGNGYRAFNPVLMRFNSPDSWSPFGEGGLNAYGYCLGDPINRLDPTGHANWLVKAFRNIVRRATHRSSTRTVATTANSTEDAMRLGNNVANNMSLDPPPPPYSPPRSPRNSIASTISGDLSSLNGEELLGQITHLENQASIQRSVLNDIANGYLPTTTEGHIQRVEAWRKTQRRIVRRQAKLPPPSFEDALRTPSPETAPDGLPNYIWAVRNT